MKNILKTFCALAIMLACYLPSNATHLMGGDTWVDKDTNTGNYYLKHTNYRDTFGVPAAASMIFKAFKWDAVSSTWIPAQTTPSYTSSLPMDSSTSGNLMTGVPYGVEVYNYSSDTGVIDSIFAQNGAGRYRFFAQSCCRNGAIQNLATPLNSNLIIHCEYNYDPTVINTSPRFLAEPIFYGPVNTPWSYNPFPFDADGDSLVWVVDTPVCTGNALNGSFTYCGGYTTPPATAAGAFTLNSVTGQLNWTPSTVGNFVASFHITEYRNGIEIGNSIRDMQYIVVNDTNSNGPINIPSFTTITNYNIETGSGGQSNSYNYLNYTPGMPLTFSIAAEDLNNNDVLTMKAIGDLFTNGSNANFTYTPSGIGNTVNGTFTWTPTAADSRDYMIVIRANDGSFSKDFTLILRKFEAPNSVTDIAKEISFKVYPNPAKANSAINFRVATSETMRDLNLQIVDISGKVVATQNVNTLSSGTTDVALNGVLQAGFYFAKLTDASGAKSETIKFVVQ